MSSPPTGDRATALHRFLPYTVIPAIFATLFFVSSSKLVPAMGFVMTLGLGLFFVFSRADFARAATGEGDERQQGINQSALGISYLAVGMTALVGFFFELARGQGAGPFTLICFVGGVTHLGSLLYLQRKR
jgi:hypothetical protein